MKFFNIILNWTTNQLLMDISGLITMSLNLVMLFLNVVHYLSIIFRQQLLRLLKDKLI